MCMGHQARSISCPNLGWRGLSHRWPSHRRASLFRLQILSYHRRNLIVLPLQTTGSISRQLKARPSGSLPARNWGKYRRAMLRGNLLTLPSLLLSLMYPSASIKASRPASLSSPMEEEIWMMDLLNFKLWLMNAGINMWIKKFTISAYIRDNATRGCLGFW